ncbi:hypothetical protein E5K00_09915 [Hymenobacter aquaticus]|uniref:STAS/SEC14 domain-containing protein n=1 Tax=Hymenobacter aquaticus TaxID=1867101 RepID=A0A4Z0Q8I3_9BACT|nr:hypothetical protein [Hymenobacter aquaticus]TGE25483.1 hypothetical protein E5K00_09915 [Hymenobacter aquaticus]
MSASESAARSITYRPDLGLLIGRWFMNAPVATLQADYRALLAAAQEHHVGRWLLDVRRRDQLDPTLGQWTTGTFYPEASRQLAPLQLRIAVLCSPARLAVYADSARQQEYLNYGLAAERPYQLQLFGDEGQAMNWLNG